MSGSDKKINRPSVLVYRSIGGDKSREGIGAGFMCKSGISRDNVNLIFPRYVLVIVLKGQGTYVTADGTKYPVSEGMFFQRFPGVMHSNFIDPESGWEEYFIDTGVQLYETLQTMRIIDSGTPVGSIRIDSGLKDKIERMIVRLKSADETELPEVLVDGVSLLVDCQKRMHYDADDDSDTIMIAEACRFLSTSFESSLDIVDFCRRNGWGYERFRKVFRQRMGISPGKYRMRRRLDASCEMLSASTMSIAEISAALGYSSPYEFSAQFKKHIGIAPKFFRDGRR